MLDIPAILPAVRGEGVADVVRSIAAGASNLRGMSAGVRPADMVASYVRFVEQAERLLGAVFTVEAVADLLHTPAYWSLVGCDPMAPRVISQVLTECERLERRLEDVQDKVRQNVERWVSPARTLVVPDTNIFLDPHHDVAAVDWQLAAGTTDGVRVVIPLVVIYELDRSKRNGSKDTNTKARAALKWLSQHLRPRPPAEPTPLTDGTTLEVYVHEGPARPHDADGMIIQFAGQLDTLSGLATLLFTRDLSMRLRAEAHGLEVRQLRDERD
ncbi:MAG TPA: PIN domain-containing protein [Kribbella sp.]|uniref:PIN domain-containing protein n=1 Tax=Kribbella sp. TaxID=1871183 RepID=UPI002D793C01|nr:PIN domain-containing protein [Kribbella sp.]HET6292229.1 PIN domain-containing protein [Kribbella sp.]